MKRFIGILSFLFLVCLPMAAQTQQPIRVNAGGAAYTDTKGHLWSADRGFNTGSLSHSAANVTVTGTSDPRLFKSARVGTSTGAELQYQFAVANGSYNVNLYFAETFYTSAGKRRFDVQMQGVPVFSGLDIFAQAGAHHALVKSAQVSVTTGQIIVRFVHHANANKPVIAALEILPSSSSSAPSVTTQPVGQTVPVGQRATFSVVAAGTAPLSYQWQKNGVAIPGATSASYTTPVTVTIDNGKTFRVIVKNPVGTATSNSATLSVSSGLLPPTIITQPSSQAVTKGHTATFSVLASGTVPLSYQWQKNGTDISGATGTSYTTPATTTADNGSTFQVALRNPVGQLTSKAAMLTVLSGPTATINWSDVHQQIDGFGAASVSTGDGISNSQADLFWSTTNGVGLSLLRVQIQSDGTYPDLATMQKAQDRGVKIWGTPWSPPASMKTNGDTNNGGSLLPGSYQAYADYLSGYILGLKNSYGIDLYAFSVQNEPDYSAPWQSCIWTGQQFHDFLRNNLLPTFAKNGVTTRIITPESSGWKFDLATATLNDTVTASGVDIIAGHNYDGAGASPYSLGQSLGKGLWETEVSSFEGFDGSITNGLKWAQKINDWMTIANANAWHYWWLISGNSDNEALLGPSGQTTKRLYVMGNFSKFVRPGYFRIGTTASPVSGVSISAFKNPSTGKFAIVAINHNASAVSLEFALNGFTANSVTPWVTSSGLNLAQQPNIPVGGSTFGATLPATSVTTFVGP